ncbi:hypothetical protein AURDEDRAFT_177020 [Auricularia subglabra TFB-10046 SS5]|uniref:HECT domain-containing protein n=1 Tax=Auricularia subglabra (strain TFB-10046 / SS5) TaxID=717982 RepID=J0LBS3_AURST|nr:hypothetical protein AURDEDRAFT_177020 [Auricularia subglabra TFB-10046 SS5]
MASLSPLRPLIKTASDVLILAKLIVRPSRFPTVAAATASPVPRARARTSRPHPEFSSHLKLFATQLVLAHARAVLRAVVLIRTFHLAWHSHWQFLRQPAASPCGATRPATNLRFSGHPPTRISRSGQVIPSPQRDVVQLTLILLPFALDIGDHYFPIHPPDAQTPPRATDASPTLSGLELPVTGQSTQLDNLADALVPYGLVWDYDFEKLKPASLSLNPPIEHELRRHMQHRGLDFAGPGFVARQPATVPTTSSHPEPPPLPSGDWVFVRFNKVSNQACHTLEPAKVAVDKQSFSKMKNIWRFCLRNGRKGLVLAPAKGYVTAQRIPDVSLALQAIPVSSPHHCFPWYPLRAMSPGALLPAPDPCRLICAAIYNLNIPNRPPPRSLALSAVLPASAPSPPLPPLRPDLLPAPSAPPQRPRHASHRAPPAGQSGTGPSPSVMRNAAQPLTLVSRSLASRLVRGIAAAPSVTLSPSRPATAPTPARPANDIPSDVIVIDSDDDGVPDNDQPAAPTAVSAAHPTPHHAVYGGVQPGGPVIQPDSDVQFMGYGHLTLHSHWRAAVRDLLAPASPFDGHNPFRFTFKLHSASDLTAGAALLLLLHELASATALDDPYTPNPALTIHSPTWQALVSPNPMSSWTVGEASGDGVRRSVILEAFDHLFHEDDQVKQSFAHWEVGQAPNTFHPFTPRNGETSARQKYFRVAGMLSTLALLYLQSLPRLERYFLLYCITGDLDVVLDVDLLSKLSPTAADRVADWPKDFQSPITATRNPLNPDYLTALLVQLEVPMDVFERRSSEEHDLYTRQVFSLLTLGAAISPRSRPPEFEAFIHGLSQPLGASPDSSSFSHFSRKELGVLVDTICQTFPAPNDFTHDLFSVPGTLEADKLSASFLRALLLYISGSGHPDGIDQELIDQAKRLKASAMSQDPSSLRAALFAQSVYNSPSIPVVQLDRIITVSYITCLHSLLQPLFTKLRFLPESTFVILTREERETLTPRQQQETLRLRRSAARTHGIPIVFRTCFRELQVADTPHLQELLKSYDSEPVTLSLPFERWLHSQVLTSTSDFSIL